jgi:putative peptidoglycan lipid II flippase
VSESGQGSASGSGRAVVGAAGLLASSVLIARALGYLRDALFASEVGVGSGADAYFAAFMIPDILGYLLAAGAAATAVTPPYVKRLKEQGPEAAARFASVVVGTVGLASIGFTVILWFVAEPLVRIQFPDFDASTLEETVLLMRIVLPAQIFFLTGGILRGVLMAHGRFWPQAWAAVIYSAAPIVGGLALGGAEGFAWGTLVGAALGQWAIPVLALRQLPGAVGRMRVGLFDSDFREYVWLALPLMLGLGLTTVDEWYEKWIGGQIEVGAIAAITYARKLMMAPVGVVGQAVGAALLPSLTLLYRDGDEAGFRDLFGHTLRTTLGLGILAAGALALLALPLVELLYERRAFTAENTAAVSGLLVVLSVAVPGWVVQQVAVRGFYARGEMWRAMILSTSVALAVIPLYVIGGAREGVRGLAVASVTAISLNALITVVWLRRRTGAPRLGPLAETFARTALITLIASFIASFLLSELSFAVERAWIALPVGGVLYGLVALAAARVLGDAPLRSGIDSILARLTRHARRRSESR